MGNLALLFYSDTFFIISFPFFLSGCIRWIKCASIMSSGLSCVLIFLLPTSSCLRVNRCDIIGMFLVWAGYAFLFFNSPSGMGFFSFSVILSYLILFIILLILGFRFTMGIRWGRQKQRHWTVRLPSTTACCAWSSACPELYNPDLASSKDNTFPLLVLPLHPFYLVHWPPGPNERCCVIWWICTLSVRCSLHFPCSFIIPLLSLVNSQNYIQRNTLCANVMPLLFLFPLSVLCSARPCQWWKSRLQ